MAVRRITAASAAALALVGAAAEEKPAAKQKPEQEHYEAYMQQYLPPGDMGYADKFVGPDASYSKYMKEAGGSDDYTKYLQQYGGKAADYDKYVKMYSAMAGPHPSSPSNWKQGGTEQSAMQGDKAAHYQKYMQDYDKYMDFKGPMAGKRAGNDVGSSQLVQGGQGGLPMAGKRAGNDAGSSQLVQGGQGDYQQYMDYQKYMQGEGGAKQYMDYQKYMQGQGGAKQYMDYQKYLQGQGDYQKYMDYQKFMQGRGGKVTQDGQEAVSLSAVGERSRNESKMAPESAGKYMNGAQGGDFKQYMDYQKYTKDYAGDYQKYMTGQGAQGGDFKQFMDYQKYMKGYDMSAQSANVENTAGYQKYMDYSKYMQGGGDDFEKYMDYSKYTNGGSEGNFSKYYSLYAAGGRSQQALASVQSASDCNTTEELKAWREEQDKRIAEYIPVAYQHFAKAPVRDEYRKNLARITGKPEPAEELAVQYSAADCNTTAELKKWRNSTEAQIKEYTP
eukprot:CAMPEP_0176115090 /NCGR_PEP_ID=MMETSP0120_2-20121206/57797_1 /TAXON_ID=160619 /ORGANISM="Kryptoperidinium foliaceum, Strain CCMP 1326" /LENGTH=501 /DNA_ID=CAMNT_0017449327 /DNA_START=62 /DNA_END=1562 /DNA_ORIENTATION=-